MNENKSTQNEANNNRKKSTQHHPQNPRFSKMLDSKAALSKRGLVVIQSSGIRISMKNQLNQSCKTLLHTQFFSMKSIPNFYDLLF